MGGDDQVWMHGGRRLLAVKAVDRLPVAAVVVLACCAGAVKVCRRGLVYGHTAKRVRILWFERDGRKWLKHGLVDPYLVRTDVLTIHQALAPYTKVSVPSETSD